LACEDLWLNGRGDSDCGGGVRLGFDYLARKQKGNQMTNDGLEQLNRRIGVYTPQQIKIWQAMSPVERLEMAFQAYQFALDAVRLTERQRHPNLSEEELTWRIIRRMQGDQKLGRT
jgi:hypothetical protein